eukprot:CAMPEP_0119517830 /NCGR_PEP_ID=MMETSP1344-20130328/34618_1 /TAXON_ID=236787 /ORGANISM="Florenciella parvula, Strain CCMP2471" /LENGTH=47 /DNA_ID= /DNA_START= /DNA_END= /DNA_ORIENTATION=
MEVFFDLESDAEHPGLERHVTPFTRLTRNVAWRERWWDEAVALALAL